MKWENYFAERVQYIKRSPVREILKLTAQPEIISFAGGLPAPELFPVERMRQAFDTVLEQYKFSSFQYSTTEGFLPLRQFLAERFSSEHLKLDADNFLIVTGSQQALDLTARLFINDKDKIIVENPTYLGMLLACNMYNPTYISVGSDEEGMKTDELEALLQHGVKAIYAVPNFQNPQGTTLSEQRRKELIGLAKKYSVLVIEDNPYGELRYSGSDLPSIMELDAVAVGKQHLDGHVVYLGTFSKTLAPGLRVGWIIAPKPVINKLVEIKQSTDLHTGTLDQMLAYETIRDGFLDRHIAVLREKYGKRRDIMLSAMEKYFPKSIKWTRPDGGLFLMVTLPKHMDATQLLEEALTYKVAFVPGVDFHVNGVGHNTFRLNFSNASEAMIEEGISRLGKVLKRKL